MRAFGCTQKVCEHAPGDMNLKGPRLETRYTTITNKVDLGFRSYQSPVGPRENDFVSGTAASP